MLAAPRGWEAQLESNQVDRVRPHRRRLPPAWKVSEKPSTSLAPPSSLAPPFSPAPPPNPHQLLHPCQPLILTNPHLHQSLHPCQLFPSAHLNATFVLSRFVPRACSCHGSYLDPLEGQLCWDWAVRQALEWAGAFRSACYGMQGLKGCGFVSGSGVSDLRPWLLLQWSTHLTLLCIPLSGCPPRAPGGQREGSEEVGFGRGVATPPQLI